MTEFAYLAFDIDGRARRGAIRAAGEPEARARLAKRDMLPVSIEAVDADQKPSRPLPAKTVAIAVAQLAALAGSVPIDAAVAAVATQATDPRTRAVLAGIGKRLDAGSSLAGALAHADAAPSFPPVARAMAAAGEASGTLPVMLATLADLLDRQQAARGKLVAALVYPAVLALTALVTIAGLMIFVVPRLAEEFADLGGELPLITRLVTGASTAMLYLAPLFVVAAIGTAFWARHALKDRAVRQRRDTLLLRLPLAGPLLRANAGLRLARTLSATLGGGIPARDALALAAPAAGNAAVAAAVERVRQRVIGGGALSPALAAEPLLPPVIASLCASGEASGSVAAMLAKAADLLDREAETRGATLLALLEPAIVIVMAAVVGTIVLAVLMPILQLDTLVLG